jgi:hypothetical protein
MKWRVLYKITSFHALLTKKKAANGAILMALFAIFFLWTRKGRGRRFFFPYFVASISPSHLPKKP